MVNTDYIYDSTDTCFPPEVPQGKKRFSGLQLILKICLLLLLLSIIMSLTSSV